MMKKYFIIVLCLCSAISITSCNQRKETPTSSTIQSQLSSRQTYETFSSEVDSTDESEESISKPSSVDFVEDEAFYKDILLSYGGDMITMTSDQNGQYLAARQASPLFAKDWETPDEFTVESLCNWYFIGPETVYEMELIPREYYEGGNENFLKPQIVPQDFFEPLVLEYFNITTEQLRSTPNIYDAEQQGYWLDWGEGMGRLPEIIISDVEKNGDIRKLYIILDYKEIIIDIPDVKKILTVRLEPDGSYKFESCVTIGA